MEVLYVYKPKVVQDTVSYSWNFSGEQEIFKKNQFDVKYEGIDISRLDEAVFYEMFVSLMIPILKASNKEYLILLPKEISEVTVNFWLNYNEADNIKVFPTVKNYACNAIVNSEKPNKKIGILFGGGKDSLYAYHFNKEIFGAENIVIVSFTFPIDISNKNKIDQRREKFALRKFGKEGSPVQKVITDFRSIFKTYSYFNNTHTQLYFSLSYPIYIEYGISYLTYSYEFTEYWNIDQNGNHLFHFKKSRPEFDLFLSKYLTKRLGSFFKVFNSNYYLSENLAFKILNDRYNALNELMMCETIADPTIKWCTKCNKCGEYVLYSLANNYVSDEIDFNRFLTDSDFIKKTIFECERRQLSRNADGNINWFEGLISPIHYMSFCHMIHSIDITFWLDKLEEPAISTIKRLKDWFGNKSYEVLDRYLVKAVEALELPFENQLIDLLNEEVEPIDDELIEILFASTKVKIDYRLQYNILRQDRNTIVNERIAEVLLKTSKPDFNERFSNEVNCYNSISNKTIAYKYEEDYRGFNLFIDKSAPQKGDTVESKYNFRNLVKGKTYHLKINLYSPYKSKEYKDRFKYLLYLDNRFLVEEDIADWDNDNLINVFFNPDKTEQSLTIKIETLKTCEPWNWGKAARLIVREIGLKQCPTILDNHISTSSPFSKISEWSKK